MNSSDRDEGAMRALDLAALEETAPPAPPEVLARLESRLAEASRHRADTTLELAAEALRRRRLASPLRHPLTWIIAGFSAMATAAIVLIVVASSSGSPPASDAERPAAFAEAQGPASPSLVLERDAVGRLRRVAPKGGDGQHLLFRGEHLIRIEPQRAGLVDGVVVELDGAGGVLALRTFERGVERGPWVELDGKGRVSGSGVK